LKKRFPILKQQLEYEYILQGQLVTALCCLHNFIRKEGDGDDRFDLSDSEDVAETWQEREEVQTPSVHKDVTEKEKRHAKNFRDKIGQDMWKQYMNSVRNEA
jgi:hypothetical protein